MEQQILQFLQQARGHAFSIKEIGKALDRKQFREDPNWARPFLQSLLGRSLVQKDQDGRFLLPAEDE